MIDADFLRMLAKYRAWADRLTFDAVAALPPGEAIKPRQTLFKSMIGTLNHNYLIDRIWQAHLEGRDHGFAAKNVMLHPELAGLQEAQETINAWYVAWSESQSADSFRQVVPFVSVSGERGTMTRGEILLHVVNHATYHRGWVAEMFFQVPARNPATDLPVFLSEAAER